MTTRIPKDQKREIIAVAKELLDGDQWEIQYLWKEYQLSAEDMVDRLICKMNAVLLRNDYKGMARCIETIMDGGGGDEWRIVRIGGDTAELDSMYFRMRQAYYKIDTTE